MADSEDRNEVTGRDPTSDLTSKPEQDEVQEVKVEEVKAENTEKQKKKPSKPSLEEIKRRGREAMSAKRRDNEEDSDDDSGITVMIQEMSVAEDIPPPPVQGTGFIYDERMLKHGSVYDSEPGKSEHPQRISSCYEHLKECGLIDRCQQVPGRVATIEELTMLHSEEYVDLMKRTSQMSTEELQKLAESYDSVCLSPDTFETASVAAGSVISLAEQIATGKIRNGFAIVRPPGHHAQRDIACGYGYFNNVALAAYHARYNLNLKRILIVDWDIHHGQGTQYLFEDDPSILYFSIHRYENAAFWPHLQESNYDCIGSGNGAGFNINVPWNKVAMDDSDYIAVFQQILMPIAYEFDPELVLVSAGFDSGLADPKGEMSVTPAGYAYMTHMLMSLAEGKLALVLEGGYNVSTVSDSFTMCVRILLGEPCPPLQTTKPCDSAIQSILDTISVHHQFWNCLQYQVFPTDHDTMTIGVEIKSEDVEEEKTNEKEDKAIDSIVSEVKFTSPVHRTALVYDERMRKHRDQWNTSHPERPDRITRIFEIHKAWKLLDRCLRVEARMATDPELLALHSSGHLEKMKESQGMKNRELFMLQMEYNSIYFHQTSYECASLAAGSVFNVVKEVLTGQALNGVCITRPPGHHAEANAACGFCFFNNVALAARYAQKVFGLKRILIVDWDVHHGNGIQHMFDDDDSVLYISLHRYDHGMFYPGSPDANYDKVGKGRGKGFNINVAWNGGKMGDAEYIAAFQQIVMPIAMEFSPELVLVSAGFDAAKGDPLGGYMITPEGYAHLTHMLTSLASGRVVVVLEGGYNLISISRSMAMCTKILLGDTCPSIEYSEPSPSAVKCILNTLHAHHKYWQCLQFQVTLPEVKAVTSQTDEDTKENDSETITNRQPAGGDAGEAFTEDRLITEGMAEMTITDLPVEREEIVETSKPSEETAENSKPKGKIPDTSKSEEDSGKTTRTSEGIIDTSKTSQDEEEKIQMQNQEQAAVGTGQGIEKEDKLIAKEMQPESADVHNAKPTDSEEHDSLSEAGAAASTASILQDQVTMYAVIPLNWCPHLDMVGDITDDGLDTRAPCKTCNDPRENWVCLICYEVYCGRYINEHMVEHSCVSEHPMTLSFSDFSVWCYVCDSYVHNEKLLPAKRAAHRSKFGEDMPGFHQNLTAIAEETE
ncbi:histone deacetylase 6-like [Ptychodera flava]|uniref:histone deacetylase 6-like n=1 Tax=Ptychodera flava TaxID=63121 RepID=UPI00396A6CF2